jgi:menaquinone-dependent protoporphyrinogen oxidase
MTVLVAYASRAGSTRGVAERIAARLQSHGRDVHLDPLLGLEEVNRFEAVVLGSPIYSGAWETEAVDFLLRNARALAGRPLWTYSVGWVGKNGVTHDAKGLDEIERLAPAREHRFFVGALDASDLKLFQRIAFKRRGGMSGDLRDWAAIDAWADEIARQLSASPSVL